MNYLLAPLHSHFDMGFGATGNAFKMAADHLENSEEAKKDNLFNSSLPINFLYRHAIELHLKSAIVIFHRRLTLPYGEVTYDGDPMVNVEGSWKPFNRVHGIAVLWAYVKVLFKQHEAWLAHNTKANWTFDSEVDGDVATIEAGDPRSTFFRYPTTKDLNADVDKSSMKEFAGGELEAIFGKPAEEQKKVFAMIVENDDKEFVRGYMFDDESGKQLHEALRRFATTCDNMHAAMRWELCGGW
jgi:hypothetical protein